MKKITRLSLVVTLLLTSSSLFAQYKWSAGYRTGLEMVNMNLTTEYDFKSNNLVWNNEAFLNRTITKRVSIEAALRYAKRNIVDTINSFDHTTTYTTNQQAKQLTLSLSAKYSFLIKPAYSLYAQVGFSIMKPIINADNVFFEQGKTPIYNTFNDNLPIEYLNNIFLGIGGNYNLSKRIFLSGYITLNWKSGGGDSYGWMASTQYQNKWATHALLGLGYRF